MSLEDGCQVAVETCMGVNEDEKVVIVSDNKTKDIGLGLRKAALEITPQVRYFNLNIYGNRPLQNLPKGIDSAAHDADVTFWTGWSHDGELETLRMPFIRAALNMGRHAHMVNITEDIVRKSMSVDYEKISKFTDKLHKKIQNINKLHVKNELGTDFTATFENYKWVQSTGLCHTRGQWINLPSGEMFKPPTKMEGKIVIDGSVGDYLGEKYHHQDLIETPLTMEVKTKKRPQAVSVKSDNKELQNDVNNYINRNDCSKFVGEVGFGTNIFLNEIVDNMLQDEKFPGVHIAFGDPIAEETFADWTCPEHIDMVLTNCDIWFDDEKIMEEGNYLIG